MKSNNTLFCRFALAATFFISWLALVRPAHAQTPAPVTQQPPAAPAQQPQRQLTPAETQTALAAMLNERDTALQSRDEVLKALSNANVNIAILQKDLEEAQKQIEAMKTPKPSAVAAPKNS